MKSIPVGSMKPLSFFSDSVFLDQKYILLTTETPVTEALLKRLSQWGFNAVYSSGDVSATQIKPAASDDKSPTSSSVALIEKDVKEKEHREEASKAYEQFVRGVDSLFSTFEREEKININTITEHIKKIIAALKTNRKYLLQFDELGVSSENYVVNHTAKTTILALILGEYLKFPPHKLIELGIAAVLHEIGMVKLPAGLYMSDKPLSPQEKKAITTHTILGYQVLRGLSFPLNISMAALEHHERMDGKGYPRGVPGEKISLYARIIAVVCSYDALTSKRPYRDGKDGHSSILDLLKNVGKQYDETVIKALVFNLSIFPIGTYVALSDGSKGIVVDVNPQTPRHPVVKILVNEQGQRLLQEPIIRTDEKNSIRVLKSLTKKEIEEIQQT